MNESFCNQAEYFPSYADFEVLRLTLIANSIFNGFLIYTAIMLNIVTICAIRRASTLPKTLKTLLTSLAISDVSEAYLANQFSLHLWSAGCDWTILAAIALSTVQRICICIVLRFIGSKFWPVLSHSFTFKISGTCDFKSSRCCGDLDMAV